MIYKHSPKNDSPRNAAGQAAKKIPLCAKKKNISQRRGVAKEERNPFAPFLLCVFA
jgi:hypothetical protein